MASGPAPTYAAFLARCSFPEAFSGIAQATIEGVLQDNADYVAAAFGDRAILPILTWDGSCDRAVRHLTFRDLMACEGYNSNAGADVEIINLAEEAKAFRQGIIGKTEHPMFTDSHSGAVPDAPRILSSATSDAWVTSRRSRRRCC